MSDKTCSLCKESKDVSLFSADRQKSDGLCSRCKQCDALRVRNYYAKNKDISNKRTAEFRKNNPEKHRLYSKNHYEKNKASYRQREIAYQMRKKTQAPAWLSKAHIAEMEGIYMFCQIFKGYQVDHIVPIRGKEVSGLHVPWNLQAISRRKNAQKSNTFNPSIYPQQGKCAFMEKPNE